MKALDHLKQVFENVNKKITDADQKEYEEIIKESEALKEKATKLGQRLMIDKINKDIEARKKELNVIKKGYQKYCYRDDIRKVIDRLSKEKIKNLVLEKIDTYTHDIPNENAKEIEKAKKYFDQLYILHTAFDDEVKEKDKEKDPICFGSILVEDKHKKLYYSERLFFITEWEDEYCDLTLEKFVELATKIDKDNKGIVKDVEKDFV